MSATAWHNASSEGRSVTSEAFASVRDPSSRNSAATSSTASSRRLLTITSAPALAYPSATAFPMPLAPPSTTATLSFRVSMRL